MVPTSMLSMVRPVFSATKHIILASKPVISQTKPVSDGEKPVTQRKPPPGKKIVMPAGTYLLPEGKKPFEPIDPLTDFNGPEIFIDAKEDPGYFDGEETWYDAIEELEAHEAAEAVKRAAAE